VNLTACSLAKNGRVFSGRPKQGRDEQTRRRKLMWPVKTKVPHARRIGTRLVTIVLLAIAANLSVSAASIESFIEGLGSRSVSVRADSRQSLRVAGAAAVPFLIRATEAEDAIMRWEAVNLLGILGDPRATNAVFRVATTDLDVHARWRANWALVRLDDGSCIPRLLAALNGEDPAVAWNSAVSLSLFGTVEAVPALHRGLSAEGWRPWEAVNALGRVWNDETPARLMAVLKTAPENVRKEAALSLGRIGGKLALEGLLDALRGDPSSEVRWRAAMMLGRIGDEGIATALVLIHKTEEDSTVLEQIDRAIERLMDSP